jgi:hypothetical protein
LDGPPDRGQADVEVEGLPQFDKEGVGVIAQVVAQTLQVRSGDAGGASAGVGPGCAGAFVAALAQEFEDPA